MWVGYMHQSRLYMNPCEFLCGIALHHTMETPGRNLLWMESIRLEHITLCSSPYPGQGHASKGGQNRHKRLTHCANYHITLYTTGSYPINDVKVEISTLNSL